jgi:hypothetical protein
VERRCWLGSSQSWNWTGGRKGTAVTRSLWRKREKESNNSESERDARKKTKGNGVNPTPGRPIYRESTESIHCGSFHRTIRLNGSILRTSRDDLGGFFATT